MIEHQCWSFVLSFRPLKGGNHTCIRVLIAVIILNSPDEPHLWLIPVVPGALFKSSPGLLVFF